VEVRSIAAFYDYAIDTLEWNIKPDHIALQSSDITTIIQNNARP